MEEPKKFTEEEIAVFLKDYNAVCAKHGMKLVSQFAVAPFEVPANEPTKKE